MEDWQRRAIEAEEGFNDPRSLIPGQLKAQIKQLKEDFQNISVAVAKKQIEKDNMKYEIDLKYEELDKVNAAVGEIRHSPMSDRRRKEKGYN